MMSFYRIHQKIKKSKINALFIGCITQKTQKFQRAPQLEKIAGFPTLKGEFLQDIDFGQGQIYKVDQGLLYPVKQE